MLNVATRDAQWEYTPISPTAFVLPTYRLKDQAADRRWHSRFFHKQWNLEPGNEDPNLGPHANLIYFDHYPNKWREFIRAFGWCALNFDHRSLPDRLEPVRPSRLKEYLRDVVLFCSFVDRRGKNLADIDDDDLSDWLGSAAGKSWSVRLRKLLVVRRIYYYRRHLPVPVFPAWPWYGLTNYEILGSKTVSDENATPRVPRRIIEPMFAWAMFYVNVASRDLLELLGEKDAYNPRLEPQGGFASIPGTQVSWRTKYETVRELEVDAHYLVIAAYIIVAYLSGMRDGEVQSIGRGAAQVELDKDGRPRRYRLRARSSAKKNGRKAFRTWIVLPEVHQALTVLERLADVMSRRSPDAGSWKNTSLLFRRYRDLKSKDVSFHSNVSRWLNRFHVHVNTLAAAASSRSDTKDDRDTLDYLYTIPDNEEGGRWTWITKQFRRTIAWYIANEPFGVVAGMRQFGHIREVTFQGYAGDPEAGFRDEIEKARELGKAQDILEIYETVRDGGRIGGAKGAQLTKEFQDIARRLGDLPGIVVDDSRLLRMLKNVAKTVYPGILNDCFFDAATALCLRRRPQADKQKPVFAQCDFEKCPNSCFWHKHRPMIELSLTEARKQRSLPKLSKNQRFALDVTIGKFERAMELAS